MMKNSSALKRYYREIRSWLPVSSGQKNKIVGDLSSSIDAYLDTHPEADLQEIQAHFGNPSSIASAYVDNADTVDLLRDLRIRKRTVFAVVVGVLTALFLVISTLALEVTKFHDIVNGGITETITDNSVTEIIS